MFGKPKTVAAAIANLTKAQVALERVCTEQAELADERTAEAERVKAEADAALKESRKALAVANKLREITEAE